MPAKIRSLHEITRDSETGAITGRTLVYPDTIVSAIHMPDGSRTLEDALEDLSDDSSVTTFNQDGSITKTMTNSGMIHTTVFGDNVITETCTYSDETPYYTQTTTFNQNGSITVVKEYADNTGGDD